MSVTPVNVSPTRRQEPPTSDGTTTTLAKLIATGAIAYIASIFLEGTNRKILSSIIVITGLSTTDLPKRLWNLFASFFQKPDRSRSASLAQSGFVSVPQATIHSQNYNGGIRAQQKNRHQSRSSTHFHSSSKLNGTARRTQSQNQKSTNRPQSFTHFNSFSTSHSHSDDSSPVQLNGNVQRIATIGGRTQAQGERKAQKKSSNHQFQAPKRRASEGLNLRLRENNINFSRSNSAQTPIKLNDTKAGILNKNHQLSSGNRKSQKSSKPASPALLFNQAPPNPSINRATANSRLNTLTPIEIQDDERTTGSISTNNNYSNGRRASQKNLSDSPVIVNRQSYGKITPISHTSPSLSVPGANKSPPSFPILQPMNNNRRAQKKS